jgi:hypothetical protein
MSNDIFTFSGMCDSSAAISLDRHRFVAADDEDNILRTYDVRKPGPPLHELDVSEFLGIDPDDSHPETDLEGAVRIGRRIYWIGSHGRNGSGKLRRNREVFFATKLSARGASLKLQPEGRPCRTLLEALVETPCAIGLGLPKLTKLHKNKKKKLAPKKKGINVEGICASRDGNTLFIGFRNPLLRDGRTLVMPLLNAKGIVDAGDHPQFGAPLLWDLKGLGVRSMQFSATHDCTFVLAGPPGRGTTFRLFRKGKHLLDSRRKEFRAFWVKP